MRLRLIVNHRWDKISKKCNYDYRFKNYELGVWLRPYRVVTEVRNKKFISAPSYQFGIKLMVIHIWIDYCKKKPL